MVNETILAVIIAFVISAILCPIVIPFLHKLKFGQQVRDDGPSGGWSWRGNPAGMNCCGDRLHSLECASVLYRPLRVSAGRYQI